MKDKNGKELVTGMAVRISGACFSSNNGLYFITASPGDAGWCGESYALKRLCRNGKISKAKYSVQSWPLTSFMNDRRKCAEADAWNAEHAEIEEVEVGNMNDIAAYFTERAEEAEVLCKEEVSRFGWNTAAGTHCRRAEELRAAARRAGGKKEYRARIIIPKQEAGWIDRILIREPASEAECFPENETCTHTAEFPDGYEMDIKVCGVRYDGQEESNLPLDGSRALPVRLRSRLYGTGQQLLRKMGT